MLYKLKSEAIKETSPFNKISPGDDYKNYYSNFNNASFSAKKFGLEKFIWNGKVHNLSVDQPFPDIRYNYEYNTVPADPIIIKDEVPLEIEEPLIEPIIIPQVKLVPKPQPTIWERINNYVNQYIK